MHTTCLPDYGPNLKYIRAFYVLLNAPFRQIYNLEIHYKSIWLAVSQVCSILHISFHICQKVHGLRKYLTGWLDIKIKFLPLKLILIWIFYSCSYSSYITWNVKILAVGIEFFQKCISLMCIFEKCNFKVYYPKVYFPKVSGCASQRCRLPTEVSQKCMKVKLYF